MRSEDADLVAVMHRDLRGQMPWAGFLQRLCVRARAQSAQVVLGDLTFAYPKEAPPIAESQRVRMRYQRAYGPDDFPDLGPFRALRVRLAEGGDAWLMVQRPGVDFSAATAALLALLAENFAVAAQSFLNQQAETRALQRLADLLARLNLAYLVVDLQGNLVSQGGALAERISPQMRLRLPQPVARLVQNGVFPAALHSGDLQFLLLPEGATSVVIYIAQSGRVQQVAPELLAAFTGLTLAEARFLQQMVQGKTIAQAGAALGLTAETARYYSKQTYAKLGAANQTALLRQIDASVLRLL